MSSSASVKSLINKATKDDREPASGFILQELASRSNNIEECKNMYETILKKLNKDKPNIKKKCLRVICFVSENGSSQWRRYWQGQTDKIKECSRYSGRADPIYGDTPYKDVRELAQKTMEAIFSSTRKDTSAIASRMTSMSGGGDTKDSSSSGSKLSSITARFKSGSFGVMGGSSSSSSSSDSSSKTSSGLKITTSRGSGARTKSGRELEGFGNTDYRPDPARIAEAKFNMMTQSPAYANPGQLGGDKHPWSTGELDTKTTRKGKRKKRTAGGVFADDSDGDDDRRRSRRTLDDSDDGDDALPSKRAPTRKEAIRSDGKFERQWVDGIVTGGGVGVKIPDLKSKVQQFETLSQSHVLEYLDDKLSQDPSEVSWQALAKCLVLLTSLIKDGNSPDSVIDYFSDSPENVAELMQNKKAILRKHANAFADLVGISLEEDDDDAPTTTTETVESPGTTTSASQSTEPITSTAAVAETADDLFDFASGGSATAKGTTAASATSGTDDLLHGLTIPGDTTTTATTAAVSAGGPDDLFGGMNMSGSTGATSSSTTTTVSTTSGVPIEISSAAVTSTADALGSIPAAVVPSSIGPLATEPEPKKDDIFSSLMADPMMGLSTTTVSTSGPSGDLSGLLGGTTTAAATSGPTTQMSDQSIFGLNSGGNQPSSGVSSSSGGFGFVSAASTTSPPVLGGGGMPGGMPGGMTGLGVHPPPGSGAYGYPGSAGGGAAMMGAAGMGGQQAWHQTGGMAHHHHQAAGYGQPGMMMQGGGMPGGMMGGMMGASPAMGGMSMMTQPPASHPLFSGGGSMGGVTAAGSTGMGSYGMGSGSRMGAPDPFAIMMNPTPPVSKAPAEPDPFADLIKM